jgi:hypothetical protein
MLLLNFLSNAVKSLIIYLLKVIFCYSTFRGKLSFLSKQNHEKAKT